MCNLIKCNDIYTFFTTHIQSSALLSASIYKSDNNNSNGSDIPFPTGNPARQCLAMPARHPSTAWLMMISGQINLSQCSLIRTLWASNEV